MKRILLLLAIITSLSAAAQGYNNEWIDYSKTYYKFKVGKTGMYRIPQALLAANSMGAVNADYFQLWRNGKQVPLYTTSTNAPIGAGGYIEFWGEMNDGKPDKALYREADWQMNDKWSLSTDTAFFFLTVNPVPVNNARLTPTTNDVAGNTLSAEPFFMYTAGSYPRNKISPGRSELVGVSYTYSSSYDKGEGFTSQSQTPGIPYQVPFTSIQPYAGPGAPDATIRINASGDAVNARYALINLNGDSIAGPQLDYYDYIKYSKTVPVAALTANPMIEIINKGPGTADRLTVAMVEITYPRLFNFGGASNFELSLPANSSGNYLEIFSFNRTGGAPILLDLTTGKRYVADITDPVILKFAVVPSPFDRRFVLVNQAAANTTDVTTMQQRNFVNYGLAANQGNYLMITNPLFTGTAGADPVGDYRNYRSSAAGGSYNAKIYMIDELVDQFAFGIKFHPNSIRNFIRWAKANYSQPIQNVLLIGKAIYYNSYRNNEGNPDLDKLMMVPTFGYPASDNLFTAEPGTSLPLIPIGRLSVINKAEVADYLEKLIEYEQVRITTSPATADQAWRKNVVHVVGASDDVTTDILFNALEGFRRTIEDTLYGGKTYTFKKTSSDNVEQLNNAELSGLFHTGVGLLTYFGHSSSNTLEFNLDNPNNYQNEGKYPIFNVMGCNAGNFYSFNTARLFTKETISEKYVLAKRRGSIAFMASTHLGIVHYLDIYCTRFYRSLAQTNYGSTLGTIMDEAVRNVFLQTSENDFYARFQCEQFTLHGDPAIRMYTFQKPDYVIEDQMVKVSPAFISVAEPTFKVKANIMNIGKSPDKSIVVEVKRTYPNNPVPEVIRRDTIRGIRYMDSITYDIPIVGTRDKGLNKILITVDADNEVDELFETNNSISKDVYIYEDEIRPVYPYTYSIVNYTDPKLIASTANAFAESRNYIFEIDTTESFNSAMKVSKTVTGSGGIVETVFNSAMTDSTVYYWRVAENVSTGDFKWNKSSFQYINNAQDGFAQAQYFQHKNSTGTLMRLDEADRRWKFDSTLHYIFSSNGVYPTAGTEDGNFVVAPDGDAYIRSACVGSSLIFNLIDPISFRALPNPTGQGGSAVPCATSRSWNFEWSYMTKTGRDQMRDFMDWIPDHYIVVIRNIPNNDVNGFVNEWMADSIANGAGNTLYHKLKGAGFADIDSFYKKRAFIFVYQKNHPDFEDVEAVSEGIYDMVSLTKNVLTVSTTGHFKSPVIGPASEWHTMKWNGQSIENDNSDRASVNVIGVSPNGTETTLYTDITSDNFDISAVSATQYPNMRLQLNSKDTVHATPFQLRYWELTYTPVPEGAIAPNLYFTSRDTVEAGEPYNMGIGFKNISRYDFDSLKVKVTVLDNNNVETIIPVPRQKDLKTVAPNDTLQFRVSVDTRALSGHNTVFVNFNPDNDQPEQYLFNNYAFRNMYVRPDSLSPLLDVTFDGVHILNRDIVAARPDILVKLKDEAKWMILDDTSLVSVKVKYPDGTTRPFYFNNTDTMSWIPAGQAPNTNNTASINLKPYFPQDGEYELIVSGKDQSDNIAGRSSYKVAFQVINKPMISNMLNYPNPFTTQTAFVFTLTGSEVPQNIRIQVLTITGKIVREITKDELGPLHIGRNMTEFKWDGTDQYGAKLANGIYLYRVITSMNGKSLDKYKAEGDNTDKFFNKGYGKMYLMR
ncbi:MAG: hypothetical protein EOO05_08420 [Chitinophagaceae bacterium]|nr:MAG: hypothetical protein EOO05_08420 [Chitinophagaceae bacterium]